MIDRKRRRIAVILTILGGIVAVLMGVGPDSRANIAKLWREFTQYDLNIAGAVRVDEASLELLDKLEVKGRASKTGYDRTLFASTWQTLGKCTMRNLVLKRDLTEVIIDDNCRVISGKLQDPYTGKEIAFQYGPATSQSVQIDHIVAVSDAWQKGAQSWDSEKRYKFYNDPNNLVAVSREANQAKVDSDAASWLPSNKLFRCAYVSRQIQVKLDYGLWVTEAEKSAMQQVLQRCPSSNENIPH